jgi:hypothetical protein
MAAEKFQGILLLPSAGGNVKYKVSVVILIGRELPSIHTQKYVRGSSPDTLVPTDKWMIGDEMEEIGSGHALQIFMQELSTKGCLRHVDGSLQKSLVTNTKRSTESADLLLVDGNHFSQREKRDFHRLTPQACEAFSHTL